ncbi:MAG: RtcB family protein [Candidatus Omnitrophica bacterium]|nr:RtcB family protein [Candidatus Omnitrophota bacterium]
MVELTGKYNSARIFCDEVESSARQQILTFLDHIAFSNGKIRIMPDVHAGAGAVIGFTGPLGEKVIPNIIGVDIGCGVAAWDLKDRETDFAALDHFIRWEIPSGRNVRKETSTELEFLFGRLFPGKSYADFLSEIKRICLTQKQDRPRVMRSIGSLGGGNHFIEIDRNERGESFLVIHCGSRNFGLRVALFHQHLARRKTGEMKGLEYLTGQNAENYKADMRIAQMYAALNRSVIAFLILEQFYGGRYASFNKIESVHNYISFEDSIIRKGAISARKGESVIIPFNMAEGCILGEGKGNEDWNCSAPHGAGRTMSRTAARKQLDMDKFKKSMGGVWTSSVSRSTIDEAPAAYKKSAFILKQLEPAVTINSFLKPVYNFKAAE